jgi:hypothetical protein
MDKLFSVGSRVINIYEGQHYLCCGIVQPTQLVIYTKHSKFCIGDQSSRKKKITYGDFRVYTLIDELLYA